MTYKVGTHYHTVKVEKNAVPVLAALQQQHPQQVLVLEFFSYGCGGCFHFESALNAWRNTLPPLVAFKQIPVNFHEDWQPYGRAFYTLEALKAPPELHLAIFKSIHEQRKLLSNDKDMMHFLKEQPGIDKNKLEALYPSFSIDKQRRTALDQAKAFGIAAIPQLIIVGPQEVIALANDLPGGVSEILAVASSVLEEQLKKLPDTHLRP